MKKLTMLLGIALCAGSLTLTSCSDDNNEPDVKPVETLSGIYTINGGNSLSKIPGSITAYDYLSGTSTDALEDAFLAKNGIELGDTPQSAIVYGSKMYIAVYNSNIIWVVNPQTLEIISSIRPDAASGSPRYLASHNGKVYASMYTGYVAQIDTVSMKIDRTITVGPNPEQLAVAGNRLYVANSDGDNYKNGYANCSISVIDLKSYAETKIQDAKTLLNPVDMVSNGTDVFVICKGNYSDIPAMVKKIEGDTPDKVKDVCGATNIAIRNNELFVIDAPYGSNAETAAYKVYDTKSCRELRDMVEKKVESPSTFAVDPVNGDIVIASYTLNASTGYAQYAEPGYANIYSADGTFKTSFKCGVGTQYITFTHSMK